VTVECFAYREAVARVERQRNPGAAFPQGRAIPDFASLNPGYLL